jgi:D-aminoacyl-tRNA deacylase
MALVDAGDLAMRPFIGTDTTTGSTSLGAANRGHRPSGRAVKVDLTTGAAPCRMLHERTIDEDVAMKALVQRVSEAAVMVGERTVGAIGRGLLVLLGVEEGDGDSDAALLARKIAHLRIFEDDAGKMNRSVLEVGGGVLVVSQFTLCADVRKGNRPSFVGAAAPERAQALYARFCEHLGAHGAPVARGEFAAHMAVRLVNDGPVTIWLDGATLPGRR